jgi:histidine ammonia-lyase
VAYYGEDRLFAPDIEAARRLVLDGDLGDSCRVQLADLALV